MLHIRVRPGNATGDYWRWDVLSATFVSLAGGDGLAQPWDATIAGLEWCRKHRPREHTIDIQLFGTEGGAA